MAKAAHALKADRRWAVTGTVRGRGEARHADACRTWRESCSNLPLKASCRSPSRPCSPSRTRFVSTGRQFCMPASRRALGWPVARAPVCHEYKCHIHCSPNPTCSCRGPARHLPLPAPRAAGHKGKLFCGWVRLRRVPAGCKAGGQALLRPVNIPPVPPVPPICFGPLLMQEFFTRAIERPIKNRDPVGLRRLQVGGQARGGKDGPGMAAQPSARRPRSIIFCAACTTLWTSPPSRPLIRSSCPPSPCGGPRTCRCRLGRP